MSQQVQPKSARDVSADAFSKDLFEVMDKIPPPQALDGVEHAMLLLMQLQVRVAIEQLRATR